MQASHASTDNPFARISLTKDSHHTAKSRVRTRGLPKEHGKEVGILGGEGSMAIFVVCPHDKGTQSRTAAHSLDLSPVHLGHRCLGGVAGVEVGEIGRGWV